MNADKDVIFVDFERQEPEIVHPLTTMAKEFNDLISNLLKILQTWYIYQN